ncbi:mandelate racemase/muconate lactonizing enzyme family protein [Paracoccus sp. SY]|uniref:mandelate racemase/muconate lactonizing enzyme family protein n=1 Tax=Paracoccus sp. SY TaxID=1330255 RepID=UPI000CD2E7A6|nr:enolase C-terminal domain-like protein [Paracoccus sp. SY]
MATITKISVRRLNLPLVRPYRLSYRTFEVFEPFLVEIEDADGRTGFGDAHVSPGSSAETREGGWAFLTAQARAAIGCRPEDAKASILDVSDQSKVAATSLVAAIEVLENHPALTASAPSALPLLAPLNATEAGAIQEEIDNGTRAGFRTFKVKVGKDVQADLDRVRAAQVAAHGRATLRLDANRAFSREDALRFADGLDPSGIELFEQPCDAEDWDANAAIAAASPVPLMLDEPISSLADIERAGAILGVGFCKLKLKRFVSLDRLRDGLEAVRTHGMEPVLGDGLGSEVHSWLEACVARTTIRNAGEFNGFLKPRDRLFSTPLRFENGAIHLGTASPRLDRATVDRLTTEHVTYS